MTDRNPQFASPETMRALCEAILAVDDEPTAFVMWNARPELSAPVRTALAAYRRETRVPLRTRAEVDAELGDLCRQYYAGSGGTQQSLLSIHERLKTVSHEAFAEQPHGPSSVDTHGSPPARAAAGATSTAPERCSCDEALELRKLLDYARRAASDIATVLETTP